MLITRFFICVLIEGVTIEGYNCSSKSTRVIAWEEEILGPKAIDEYNLFFGHPGANFTILVISSC